MTIQHCFGESMLADCDCIVHTNVEFRTEIEQYIALIHEGIDNLDFAEFQPWWN